VVWSLVPTARPTADCAELDGFSLHAGVRAAALVLPPHANQILCHGVLASAAAMRRYVTPDGQEARESPATAETQDTPPSAARAA